MQVSEGRRRGAATGLRAAVLSVLPARDRGVASGASVPPVHTAGLLSSQALIKHPSPRGC